MNRQVCSNMHECIVSFVYVHEVLYWLYLVLVFPVAIFGPCFPSCYIWSLFSQLLYLVLVFPVAIFGPCFPSCYIWSLFSQQEVVAALPMFIQLTPTLVKGVLDRLLVSHGTGGMNVLYVHPVYVQVFIRSFMLWCSTLEKHSFS